MSPPGAPARSRPVGATTRLLSIRAETRGGSPCRKALLRADLRGQNRELQARGAFFGQSLWVNQPDPLNCRPVLLTAGGLHEGVEGMQTSPEAQPINGER